MKKLSLFFLVLVSGIAIAQQDKNVGQVPHTNEIEIDSVALDTIVLDEVLISKIKMNAADKKAFQLLQYRVYKVYPFAKLTAEKLTTIKKNIENLKTHREKKRYMKIVEDYLNNEFKDRLKNLSRKQGQILVKLIYRQTGATTYDLIKEYKSGWKAFWSNTTAYLFDINLKESYQPFADNEDFWIETILYRAFVDGRLAEQKPATPIDFDALNAHWEQLAKDLKK
ncbi:DUF4294 domain-containing protein [Flavobacterium sp.]|uniref:DUF4294 domain-containing protein n=1 Tax=Flavobacterium sp. TaxID=239 RepID=UPI00261D5639|nr:DUF4294 domain-containing protein [Flavobacterium sp.]